MDNSPFCFLDFIDGTADEADRAKFQHALASDTALAEDFSKYRSIGSLCELLGREHHALDHTFCDEVLVALCDSSALPDSAPYHGGKLHRIEKQVVGALGSLATLLSLVLCLMIQQSPDAATRAWGSFYATADTSQSPQALHTIELAVTDSMGEIPGENAFVSVGIRMNQFDSTSELQLAQFVRVKSVHRPQGENQTLITLEASNRLINQLELARTIAEIHLLPIVSAATELSESPSETQQTIKDPEGRTIVEDIPSFTRAVLYLNEGAGGPRVARVYHHGQWQPIGETTLLAF
jgi:hypothetical protein